VRKSNEVALAEVRTNDQEIDMGHHLTGPFWGNVVILIIAGVITVACFVTMFWMLLRPGETDPNHPKYSVLRHDR
jgi:hypothetical protein